MKPRTTPSNRQLRVLRFVHLYIREHGCSPSYRDISEGCDIPSSNGVAVQLQTLKRFGLISYLPKSARTVRPTPEGLVRLGLAGYQYINNSVRELRAKDERIAQLESQVELLKHALRKKHDL